MLPTAGIGWRQDQRSRAGGCPVICCAPAEGNCSPEVVPCRPPGDIFQLSCRSTASAERGSEIDAWRSEAEEKSIKGRDVMIDGWWVTPCRGWLGRRRPAMDVANRSDASFTLANTVTRCQLLLHRGLSAKPSTPNFNWIKPLKRPRK